MRLTMSIVVCALVACGSGNGNGHHADDPADVQRSVWFCVPIVEPDKRSYPCSETLEMCENDRVRSLAHGFEAGKCERFSFSVCVRVTRNKTHKDFCSRTKPICELERQVAISNGYEVTDCEREPPESSHRPRSTRSWRTAGR